MIQLRARRLGIGSKLARALWQFVWLLLYRPTPNILHYWRAALLRLFGAKIGRPAYIYPSSRVWAPWNLEIGDHSTLADNVDCYAVDKIVIGSYSTVSQGSFLCTASHDYLSPLIMTQPEMPLVSAPITIGDRVWVTAGVFVAPGVTIADGAVILARSCVVKDVSEWTVVAGNPARAVRRRVLKDCAD